MLAAQAAPSAVDVLLQLVSWGSPNRVLNAFRSAVIVDEPGASTMAIVVPDPPFPAVEPLIGTPVVPGML